MARLPKRRRQEAFVLVNPLRFNKKFEINGRSNEKKEKTAFRHDFTIVLPVGLDILATSTKKKTKRESEQY